jgi:hypothetical protein
MLVNAYFTVMVFTVAGIISLQSRVEENLSIFENQ